ncbi:hypothetical protein BBF96_01850 [Anoxybacter fermentans]|uniref:DUF4912 domain-containing protein n=1 Tax=Anoxybacter fermentans TaxID=1323375 RepID=A0A3Q9HNS7_9FIRM|nr:DUF4912 domain-containing protein [Anoxybacter fermentans]AZR72248.1 hypothetical protein BBF96_01850 [Anoxybacter fermentans]
MIKWIILLIPVLIAIFYFISKREKGDKEVVLPPRKNEDMEIAEEPNISHKPEWENKLDLEVEREKMKRKSRIELLKDEEKTKTPEKFRPVQVLELDYNAPADHVIQIGVQPEPISGYEMAIDMELNPTLIALAKDPYWVFVYWVLPPDAPSGKWELKVRNFSQQIDFFQAVDPKAGNWYLYLNQPDQKFIFELGVRDEAGHFHPILCSNEVQTPPDRPSNIVDTKWMTIDEFYQKKIVISPEGSPEFIIQVGGKIGASEQMIQ